MFINLRDFWASSLCIRLWRVREQIDYQLSKAQLIFERVLQRLYICRLPFPWSSSVVALEKFMRSVLGANIQQPCTQHENEPGELVFRTCATIVSRQCAAAVISLLPQDRFSQIELDKVQKQFHYFPHVITAGPFIRLSYQNRTHKNVTQMLRKPSWCHFGMTQHSLLYTY